MYFIFLLVVFQRCIETLENLRSIKASLDGTEVKVTAPDISEDFLQELRQLTLLHIPSSLTDSARQQMASLIKSTFEGTASRFHFRTIFFGILLFLVYSVLLHLIKNELEKVSVLFSHSLKLLLDGPYH